MPFVSTDTSTFDSTNNRYNLSIAENSAAGAIIGHIRFDGGGDGEVLYTLSGPDSGKVRLAPDGTLTLAPGVELDYEASGGSPRLAITIDALFIGNDGNYDEGTINQQITTTNVDEGPILVAKLDAASFAEHSPNNTVIARFSATDEGGDDLSYSLTGDYAELFTIMGNEVRLKNAKKFDFETLGASIDLTLNASSTGSSGTAQTAEQTLTVNITDMNEPLTFTPQVTPFDVPENSTGGTAVGQVSARDGDGDPVTYSLASHKDKFVIDSATGAITVKDGAVLDYEALKTTKGQITLTVNAVANGPNGRTSDATQDVTIQLGNVNEPVTFDAPPQTFTLDENSAAGTAIGTVTATDGDGDPVTYSLYGTGDENFTIDSKTGAISVAKRATLDFETKSEYVLKVGAGSSFEGGQPTIRTQVVRIKLNDLNEPLAFDPITPFELAENSVGGTAVGQVSARDGDGDTVTYSLASHSDTFVIDSVTGTITVKDGAVLDYEALKTTKGQITLTVNAVANGSNGRKSDATQDVTIQLGNVNEDIVWSQSPQTFTVDENSAGGTVVGTVSARDGDGDPVTYSLGSHSDKFDIDSATGAITVKDGAVLDYEALKTTKGAITVSVNAVANGPNGRTSNASQDVTVQLRDVNEPLSFTSTQTSFTVPENSSRIGQITAVDADGDTVRYSLQGTHASLFQISNSGEITVKSDKVLDYETLPADGKSFNLGVVARAWHDTGGDSSAIQDITITVTNVDEAPVFTNADGDAIDQIYTGLDGGVAAAGSAIATLRAIDPDGDASVRYFVRSHRDKFMLEGTTLKLRPDVALTAEQIEAGITVRLVAMTRQDGNRPQVTEITLHLGEQHDLTATHAETSQQDLAGILNLATRVADFDGTGDQLRFADGVSEVWYRQINDPSATSGKSTLITAFNGTTNAEVHYAVIEDWTGAVSKENLIDSDTIELKKSIILGDTVSGRPFHTLNGHFWSTLRPYLSDNLYDRNDNHIQGGALRDHIFNFGIGNRINGGANNDILGGLHSNVLTGGPGQDRFVVKLAYPYVEWDEINRVTDFDNTAGPNRDFLDLGENHAYIFTRQMDIFNDGHLDTVIFFGGTSSRDHRPMVILEDFTGELTTADIYNYRGTQRTIPTFNENLARVLTYSGNNSEWIFGSRGKDQIDGMGGDDVIDGREGKDILNGGEGNDIFVLSHPVAPVMLSQYDNEGLFYVVRATAPLPVLSLKLLQSGVDVVLDFEPTEDKFRINPLGEVIEEVWYQRVDINGDGTIDYFLLRDAPENGRTYGLFFGNVKPTYQGELTLKHFDGDNIKRVTKIPDEDLHSTDPVPAHRRIGDNNNNHLYGGGGPDHFVGNGGKDTYTGRGGADVFDVSDLVQPRTSYEEFYEDENGNSVHQYLGVKMYSDVITDFGNGDDKLKFSIGVSEVWYEVTDFGSRGRGTVVTAFDATKQKIMNYVFLKDFDAPLTSEHFVDTTIVAKKVINSTFVFKSDYHGTVYRANGTENGDFLRGTPDGESMYGGNGNDTLIGGYGDDHLHGGRGNDILIGQQGVDHLYGGAGRDVMTGGSETDIFHFRLAETSSIEMADRITDYTIDRDSPHYGRDHLKIDDISRYSPVTIWRKVMDVDDDGVNDTVLYARDPRSDETSTDNVLVILEDYSNETILWYNNATVIDVV